MGKLFALNGPIVRFFSKLISVILLSVLWTITSIPIITIGASNVAIYYVFLKSMDEKDINIFKEYFKTFKENFKKATKIWIPLLLIILVGVVDVYICLLLGGTLAKVSAVLFMCVEILLMIAALYLFPIMSRFKNDVKQTIKISMLMPIKHYICTLWLIGITTIVIALGALIPFAVFVLPGMLAFVTSYPLYFVFRKYESDVTNPVENGILPDFEIRQLSTEQLKKYIKTPNNNYKKKTSKDGKNKSSKDTGTNKDKLKKEKKKKDNVF